MTTLDLEEMMGKKKGAIEVTCFTGKIVYFQDHEESEKTPTHHSTVTHLASQYVYKFVHLGKLVACFCLCLGKLDKYLF